jgi:hypothetical protein
MKRDFITKRITKPLSPFEFPLQYMNFMNSVSHELYASETGRAQLKSSNDEELSPHYLMIAIHISAQPVRISIEIFFRPLTVFSNHQANRNFRIRL